MVAETSIDLGQGATRNLPKKRLIMGGSGTFTFLILFAIFCPIILNAGSISLPAPRVMVLMLFLPAIWKWLTGQLGRFRAMDFIVLALSVWVLVATLIVHGMSQLEFGGALAVETFGPYLVGRWCIRDKTFFKRFVKIQFWFILVILPFALLEAKTGDPLIISLLATVFDTQDIVFHEIRMGLERAQAVFQHPILYGYFAAVTFGLVVYVLNTNETMARAAARLGVIFVSTFLSLSSGPLAGLMVQIILSLWERMTRGFALRWTFVLCVAALMYIVVDVISDRTPFHVFIRYLTFNTGAAYNRILIFEYGIQNVQANPIFGIGLNDWVRPSWMVSSVDNFWLAIAMRHGLPALFFLALSFVVVMVQIGRRKYEDREIANMRTGVNMSLVGTIFIGATVHLWGPVYIWLWFFIGGSMWLLNETAAPASVQTEDADEPVPQNRFSRFDNIVETKPEQPPNPRQGYREKRLRSRV